MKFISPKVHGIIDLISIAFLLASPSLFDFNGTLATFTYVLAAACLLMVLLTNYGIGIVKVIPFTVHGSVEFILGVALVVLAYTLFKDEVTGKLYYILFGTFVLLTWLCTDYANKNVVIV